ncbi:MAG TPA: UMP kinase, partial [Patescibacteria group bacterium]|nr:UMP kinase [Patescibacteria group bacterium]
IIIDPTQKIEMNTSVVFGAGWKPGWSTDFDAVQFAIMHDIPRVVNLSNIAYVYDKDPKKFLDAKPIKDITWTEFRKLVGTEWKPGLNMPFDPIASKLAQEHGIEVVIADGTQIENVRAILDNKPFTGTIIHQ